MAQGWCNTVIFDRLVAPDVEALDLALRVFVPFSAIHISLGQVPDIPTPGNP